MTAPDCPWRPNSDFSTAAAGEPPLAAGPPLAEDPTPGDPPPPEPGATARWCRLRRLAGAVALASAAAARPSRPWLASADWVEGASGEGPAPPDSITFPVELLPAAVGTLSTYSFAPELPGGMYGRSFAAPAAGSARLSAAAIKNALTVDGYGPRPRKLTKRLQGRREATVAGRNHATAGRHPSAGRSPPHGIARRRGVPPRRRTRCRR